MNKPSKGEEVIKKIKLSKVKQEKYEKVKKPSLGKELIDDLEEKEKVKLTINKGNGPIVTYVEAIPKPTPGKYGIPKKKGDDMNKI